MLDEITKPTSPWPPAIGYEYRYRFGRYWHQGVLQRIDNQDPNCVLYGFGKSSVRLEAIEKPKERPNQ